MSEPFRQEIKRIALELSSSQVLSDACQESLQQLVLNFNSIEDTTSQRALLEELLMDHLLQMHRERKTAALFDAVNVVIDGINWFVHQDTLKLMVDHLICNSSFDPQNLRIICSLMNMYPTIPVFKGFTVLQDFLLTPTLLGRGNFSEVVFGYCISTGQQVAVKVIDYEWLRAKHPAAADVLAREVDLLRQCKHPNIVGLLADVTHNHHLYLVMEYCSGGSLEEFMAKRGALSEAEALFITRQIAEGLKVLDRLDLLHRDIKPANILFTCSPEEWERMSAGDGAGGAGGAGPHTFKPAIAQSDDGNVLWQLQVKICDFGFAKEIVGDIQQSDTRTGSPAYMPPETLLRGVYDKKRDVYAVGMMLYQMIVGDLPFRNSYPELFKWINDGQDVVVPAGCRMSKQCRALVKALLKKDHLLRITFHEFIQDPLITPPPPPPSTSTMQSLLASRFLVTPSLTQSQVDSSDQVRALQASVEQLEKEVETLLKKSRGTEVDLAACQKALADKEGECAGLRQSLGTAQSQVSELSEGLAAANKKLEEEKQAGAVMATKFEFQSAQLARIEGERDKAVEDVRVLRGAGDSNAAEMERMAHTISKLQSENAEVTAALVAKTAEAEGAEAKTHELSTQVAKLTKDMEALGQEKGKAETDLSRATQAAQAAEARLAGREHAVSTLQRDNAELLASVTRLSAQLKECNERAAAIELARGQDRKEHHAALMEAQHELSTVVVERDELAHELAAARRDLGAMDGVVQDHLRRENVQRQQHTALTQQVERLTVELDAARQQCAAAEAKAKSLEETLNDKEKYHEANTKSLLDDIERARRQSEGEKLQQELKEREESQARAAELENRLLEMKEQLAELKSKYEQCENERVSLQLVCQMFQQNADP